MLNYHKTESGCIIVLGMHRSGTSALAGVLSMLGANPGSSLMPGLAGVNPKGFWEHRDIVSIHDRLLASINSSWDDERPFPKEWWRLPEIEDFRAELIAVVQQEFSASQLWLLKDPRICRLLPLWLEILDQLEVKPHFVISLRHPGEVSKSLELRDGIQAERACLLWLEHVIESERLTRDLSRVIVTYESLLADWRGVVNHIAKSLSIPLSVNEVVVENIDAFLEPSLRHYSYDKYDQQVGDEVCGLAMDVFEILLNETGNGQFEKLAAIEDEMLRAAGFVSPWATEIYTIKRRVEFLESQSVHLIKESVHLIKENVSLQGEVERIMSTVSWKITKPLRGIWNTGRNLVGILVNYMNR